jgi:pantoate--beta-alanine ligase
VASAPEMVRDPAAMRRRTAGLRRDGRRLGFVPTMGALHAGHLGLVDLARAGCDLVIVSIFVNPLQFGPGEDYDRYPRDLDADLHRLAAVGCDLVFAPEARDMVAPGARTRIVVEELEDRLCGRSRPGHFRGVATIVTKLFHLVQPHVAVFGQKDAQQALLLQRMVQDLDLDVELRFAPIARDADGLALSSRNAYLDADERRAALRLHQALGTARDLVVGGESEPARVLARVRNVLAQSPEVRVDYVELVAPSTLAPVHRLEGRVLLALAAWVGTTRLIDNIVLEVRGADAREVALVPADAGPLRNGGST